MKPGTRIHLDGLESFDILNEALEAGEILLYPTETVWGLGARVTSETGLAKLAQVKSRTTGDNPFLVLVASMEQALDLAVFDMPARMLADVFWPGPLAIVLPARVSLPGPVLGRDGTVGLRMSPHPVAMELCKRLGPVTTTSANVHGKPPPSRLCDVDPFIRNACITVFGELEPDEGVPSTVVSSAGGRVTVLREGAIPVERIMSTLEALH